MKGQDSDEGTLDMAVMIMTIDDEETINLVSRPMQMGNTQNSRCN